MNVKRSLSVRLSRLWCQLKLCLKTVGAGYEKELIGHVSMKVGTSLFYISSLSFFYGVQLATSSFFLFFQFFFQSRRLVTLDGRSGFRLILNDY